MSGGTSSDADWRRPNAEEGLENYFVLAVYTIVFAAADVVIISKEENGDGSLIVNRKLRDYFSQAALWHTNGLKLDCWSDQISSSVCLNS